MHGPFLGEFMGTLVLIALGDGVVANVLLKKSKGENSGWIVIATAWGMAVVAGICTAVACGSAGEFLEPAQAAGCDCLVTGEVRFHTALEAEALGVGLVLAGHFASERFALEALAEVLANQFRDTKVWASRAERDPIQWL